MTNENLSLEDPRYVAALKAKWRTAPKSMIVIEFYGTGDKFFGGSADDRALGIKGDIIPPGFPRTDEVANFDTIEVAHEAARRVTNRRPGSILGVVPTWR